MKKDILLLSALVIITMMLTAIFKMAINELTPDQDSRIIFRAFVKCILACFFFYLAAFRKISVIKLGQNAGLTLLGIILVILSFIDTRTLIESEYSDVSIQEHLVFFSNCLSVGFFEEFLCRVLVFSLLIRLFDTHVEELYVKAALSASCVFAALHLSNFFNPEYDFYSVITQIVSGFVVGFLLQSLFIRTRNIWFCIMIHGLLNYWGMRETRLFKVTDLVESNPVEDLQSSLIFIGIASLVLFPICFWMLKTARDKRVREL